MSLPILDDFHIPGLENMFAAHIKDQNRSCQMNVDHAEVCVCVCVCVGILIVVVSQPPSHTQGHSGSIPTSACDVGKSRSLKYNRGRRWGEKYGGESESGETEGDTFTQHIHNPVYICVFMFACVLCLTQCVKCVEKAHDPMFCFQEEQENACTHTHNMCVVLHVRGSE